MDWRRSPPADRSNKELCRLIAATQAQTHRLIAESRELIAQARRIREQFPKIRRGRQDAA